MTKLDAARRQLRTALELFFQDGDPVSIHTLAFASHELIHRLYKKAGFENLLLDTFPKGPDRKKVADLLKADAVFFKHADRDPDADKVFNPKVNELFLFMSVKGLRAISGRAEPADIEAAIVMWFYLHSPGPRGFQKQIVEKGFPIKGVDNDFYALSKLDKPSFLKAFIRIRDTQRRIGIIR